MNIVRAINDICQDVGGIAGLGAEHPKIDKATEARMAYDIATSISRLPFRRGEGGLFHYDGRRYSRVAEEEMRQIILGVMHKSEVGMVYRYGSVNGTMKMVYGDYRIKPFLPSRSLISFNNVLLNVQDMRTHAHGEDWMTRIHLDFDYDPKAKYNEWERFLTYVIPDAPSRMVLQEFLGLMFVDNDELSIEASMFLYGTGANGKSVVQYVVQSILGDDYCSNYELSQLCTSNDAGYNLADANGKLLNFAADMGDRDFSGGRFKAISAREPIQVRPIGQEPYKASDMPLMISNINKIPQTSDATDGYWRRFKLIHFPVTIAEDMQDKTLKPRLRMELSGIFNWILEGRARIVKQAGHFTHSDYMDKMVGRARKESNSLLSFLEENRYVPIKEVGKTYTEVPVLSRDLMKQYKDYCLVWGNMPKSKKSFLDELRSAGFEYLPVMHTPSGTSTGWRLWKVDLDFGEEFADDIPMRIEDVNPDLPF